MGFGGPGNTGGGDPGGTLRLKFTTRDSNVPSTLGGSPVVSIYKDGSTTQSVAGVSLTVDFDSVTGLNDLAIDTSADGTFYAAGSHFDAVITTGTVGGTSVVGEVIGSFDLYTGVTALRVATAVWQDTTSGDFTVSGSVGKGLFTSGAAPGASGGLPKVGTAPYPATGTLAAAAWDEILTGATHNIANSSGKLLRLINPNSDVIYSSTLPSQAGMTSTQVKLDSGASAVDNAYQYDVFTATSGTGQGSSVCTAYNGSTKVATLASAWGVQPVATDVVQITPSAQAQVINKTGFALAATGLDLITATDPGAVATTFPQMVVQVWRRFFKKSVKAVSGLTIKTYADDNTTVRTTQTYTDDGAGNQTENAAT
jgi:hypothetical protein